jgi:ABC-type transporter Mla subunit MlaD
MNPQRRDGWREVLPGIAILLTAVPIAIGIFLLDSVRRSLAEGPSLVVLAGEGRGLVEGADVWIAGKPGGRVRSISFVNRDDRPGEVALDVVLRRDAAPALLADATVTIGSSALLAPPVVKFQPGSPGQPRMTFGDTMRATKGPDMDTFRAFADSGRTALAEMTAELERLSIELERGDGTIPRALRDDDVIALLAHVRTRTAILRRSLAARRAAGPLLLDSLSLASIRSLSESASSLSDAAGDRRESLEAARAALTTLEARIDRLNLVLESGRGTAGRMAFDEELEMQSRRARAQLDSLQTELVANPFAWLRFRLF